MEKQIDFISICKGIGIILVVLGHLNIGEYWHQVIYSFHMPLFFFISGYLFKNKYLEIPKEFLLKKAKTLYIPFVKWALIFLLLHNVFVYFHIEKGMYDIKDYLIGGANILLFCNYDPILCPTWFLRSLFVSFLIFYTVLFFTRERKGYRIPVFILLLLIGTICSINDISVPYKIERDCVIASILMAGFTLRNTPPRLSQYYSQNKRIMGVCITVVSLVILLCINIQANKVDISNSRFGNPLMLVSTSFMGITLVWSFSKLITNYQGMITKTLHIIGDNSMAIFMFHVFWFRLGNLIMILVYGMEIDHLSDLMTISTASSYWIIVYSIIGVFVPLFINRIYNKLRND